MTHSLTTPTGESYIVQLSDLESRPPLSAFGSNGPTANAIIAEANGNYTHIVRCLILNDCDELVRRHASPPVYLPDDVSPSIECVGAMNFASCTPLTPCAVGVCFEGKCVGVGAAPIGSACTGVSGPGLCESNLECVSISDSASGSASASGDGDGDAGNSGDESGSTSADDGAPVVDGTRKRRGMPRRDVVTGREDRGAQHRQTQAPETAREDEVPFVHQVAGTRKRRQTGESRRFSPSPMHNCAVTAF